MYFTTPLTFITKLKASSCTTGICPPSVGGALLGGIFFLLASLFAVQATRIRFVFDKDCFELKNVDPGKSQQLSDSGENIIVGGANRWAYKSFVNWDFYPSVDFPILVYFKETQTPKVRFYEPCLDFNFDHRINNSCSMERIHY